jgi:hypothetical protein
VGRGTIQLTEAVTVTHGNSFRVFCIQFFDRFYAKSCINSRTGSKGDFAARATIARAGAAVAITGVSSKKDLALPVLFG